MNKKSEHLKIAIDGYSSCGKSSFAKKIASELGYLYIDSGAMYRAFTLYCLRESIIIDEEIDEERLSQVLPVVNINFRDVENGGRHTFLNGEDVEQEIRSMEVSGLVSPVSRIPSIRAKMVDMQRKFSLDRGVVMDGRDIGTVVFPDAAIKIFMTADPGVRAERRYLELQEKGIDVPIYEIEKNLRERDFMDENRKVSPLRKAPDAWVLDNSEMSIDDQMVWFRNILKEQLNWM
jgi:cytidylate kinase